MGAEREYEIEDPRGREEPGKRPETQHQMMLEPMMVFPSQI